MSVFEELGSNNCSWCLERKIKNADYIDIKWRDEKNKGYWPKPYTEASFHPDKIKALVIGQDPTIENPRSIEYALEANAEESRLGKFLREVFSTLRGIRFDDLYFTDLVKCRFKEKPGKDKRNISDFIDNMARECYSRFLITELKECRNARYIFTLGRDNFAILSSLLRVKHKPLSKFKEFYGTKMEIPFSALGRECYLVGLPHQPTYDLAQRYSPYRKEEIHKRLEIL
ncbi:uracil-DNA glycosylase family protein [Chloroflexota bacterium]